MQVANHLPSSQQVVEVYLDELTINQETKRFFGEGKMGNQKVLVSGDNGDQLAQQKSAYQKLIILSAELKPLTQATNTAEFDSQKYYQNLGIHYQLVINQYQMAKSTGLSLGPFKIIHQFRFELKKFYQQLPEPLNMLGFQLILGEKFADLSYDETFKKLGIIHIISISGLHVQVIAKILEKLLYLLRIRRRYTKLVTAMVLIIFVFIGNEQVGLVRAVISYLVSLVLHYLFKVKLNPLDQLGLGFSCHSLINPLMITTVGGQLSYFLVLILILTQKMTVLKQSIYLTITSLPILLFYFYSYNIFTSFYNFIAIPLFDYLILPVVLLSFLYPSCPGIFDLIAKLLLKLFDFLGYIGQLDYGMVNFGQLELALVILLLGLTIASFTFEQIKRRLLIMTGLTYLLAYLLIHYPFYGQVTFIDVGQGDSMVLTTPIHRKVLMIDTGGKLKFNKSINTKSTVEKVTVPYLKSQGISKIDALFLSHQDDDHIGDLEPLLKAIAVDTIYYGIGMQNVPKFHAIMQCYFKAVKKGGQFDYGEIKLTVLHPEQPGMGENDDSLALRATIQNKSWLFTGDLSQKQELAILNNYPNLQIDYLKLGHHGSRTSSSATFLKQINPQYAFISAGRNNRYQHPHQETLEILKDLKIKYDGTYQYGMINVYFNSLGQWQKHRYRDNEEDFD
ncbi:DNA internalization-related competence protein ComEC/Rec2 [Holzapfeliella sp. He02]|uniref:DNA internalization-related competence protein ComEC/Rec2 n=2 Tax=Holzapfeliella saturejae TaxID=3082953 RepID=A0ABU8SG44_9LACO